MAEISRNFPLASLEGEDGRKPPERLFLASAGIHTPWDRDEFSRHATEFTHEMGQSRPLSSLRGAFEVAPSALALRLQGFFLRFLFHPVNNT
jgi:hypothetical protein